MAVCEYYCHQGACKTSYNFLSFLHANCIGTIKLVGNVSKKGFGERHKLSVRIDFVTSNDTEAILKLAFASYQAKCQIVYVYCTIFDIQTFNVKHLTMQSVQMHAGAMSKFLCTSTNTLTKTRSLGQEKNMVGSGYPINQ